MKKDDTLIAENRKARHDYEIIDTIECGIVLCGSEVKSLREHRVNFRDSYALLKNSEILIIGLRIEHFKQATHEKVDPEQTRKLLLKRTEINKIEKLVKIKNLSLIPLKLYFKKHLVKLLLGIAKGKTKVDKRHTLKEQDIKKELAKVLKRRYI